MKKENKYTPKPIDTSDIILPEDLAELAEQLAKNVHEVWSQTRMEQGWTYGEERDDLQLKHPCLIPYEELPESEKPQHIATDAETDYETGIQDCERVTKNSL